MMWVFDTEQQASQAEQLIVLLGARALGNRGFVRNAEGYAIGKNEVGQSGTIATTRWSIPQETQDGKWAIADPKKHPLWNETLSEVPESLAAAGGVDPSLVNWAAYGVSDPSLEIALPGSQWMLFVLDHYGLSPAEGTPLLVETGNDEVVGP